MAKHLYLYPLPRFACGVQQCAASAATRRRTSSRFRSGAPTSRPPPFTNVRMRRAAISGENTSTSADFPKVEEGSMLRVDFRVFKIYDGVYALRALEKLSDLNPT